MEVVLSTVYYASISVLAIVIAMAIVGIYSIFTAEEDPYDEQTVKKNYMRARDKKGRYKGDDPSTPNKNEAWEGGKKPKRGRGRPKGSKNKPKAKKNV